MPARLGASRSRLLGMSALNPFVAVTMEIWGVLGDSTGVGIDDRTVGTDIAWTNTYNWGTGGTHGLTTGLTQNLPYEQGIGSSGTNPLTSSEYFARDRQVAASRRILMVSDCVNGSSFIGAATGWHAPSGGNLTHFLSRVNNCIATVMASEAALGGRAKYMGTKQHLGTNDEQTTYTQAVCETAQQALIDAVAAGIFDNGNSSTGTAIGYLPYIIVEPTPEHRAATNTLSGFTLANAQRKIAGTVQGVKLARVPEGITRSGDSLHESVPGMRILGPIEAATLTDTVAPTLTSATSLTVYEGQKMLLEITSDKYGYPRLVGGDASKLEIYVGQNQTDTNIISSRLRYFVRWAGDISKTYASPDDANTDNVYQTSLVLRSAAGVDSAPIPLTFTVAPAYGADTSAITYTPATGFAYQGSPTIYANFRETTPISFGAGMNMIMIFPTSGGIALNSITVDGITVAKHASSNNSYNLFLLPLATARTTPMRLNHAAAGAGAFNIVISNFTGTVATPTDVQVTGYTVGVSPHTQTFNVPSGGLGVGIGYDSSSSQVITSNATKGTVWGGGYYTLRRNDSGSALTGQTVGNSGTWFMGLVSFAKA